MSDIPRTDTCASLRAIALDESRCVQRDIMEHAANEIERLEQENAALWLVIEDAKPVMRDYAMHNPPWTDGFGPTQDPNGVHAWLAHNDAVMEKKHD
jgi:hypothetical protein